MTVEDNKKLALRFMELLPQGRFEELPLAPGFSAWSGTSGEIARDEYLARTRLIPKLFSEPLRFVVKAVTAEGERVAIQASGRGRLIDGHDYVNDYHMLCVFEDGRLLKTYEYMNVKIAADLLMPVLRMLRGEAPQA